MKNNWNEIELNEWSKSLPKTGPNNLPVGMKETVYSKIQNKIHQKDEKRLQWSKWQPVMISFLVVFIVSWMFWTPDIISNDHMTMFGTIEPEDAVDEVFASIDSLGVSNSITDNSQYPMLEIESQIAQLTSIEQDQILVNVAQEMEQEWTDI